MNIQLFFFIIFNKLILKMRKNNGIVIFDLDMYSNRIGFFSNNRERIGSSFGLFLTSVYILTSLVIFIFYSIDTIGRKDITVYDSNIYSNTTPTININNNDINIAFGLEDPISSNKYIDPTIYYPEVLYIDRERNEKGDFETVNRIELNFIRCKNDSFGEEYRHAFGGIQITDSYCLDDFNLTLAGGYTYNRMSYIRIKILPCSNRTSTIKCKPKETIDSYLTRGYLSIFLKDIGLNPSNYSVPILPTIQNLYTTIDRRIFREFVVNYGITEIQTDTGLFSKNVETKKYLKYISQQESFYFRTEEEYNRGKQIGVIQIRLDDNIRIQKRSYTKIPQMFSLIGGYMQLLSTVFSLISILTGLDLEVKILNNLFNFNLKQNKMTIKINNIKDFNANKHKSYKNFPYVPKNLSIKKMRKQFSNNINININNSNNNNVSISKNILFENTPKNRNIVPIINKINKIGKNAGESQIMLNNNIDNNQNTLFSQKKNQKKNSDFNISMRTKSLKNEKKIYFRPINVYTDSVRISYRDMNSNIEEEDKNIHLNLVNYYCCGSICRKKKHIELFDIGVSLYRRRMDIINVFTILLLTEKTLLKNEKQKKITINKDNYEITPILNNIK
jgi:hypothetical protein